jgi:hypothetical protein
MAEILQPPHQRTTDQAARAGDGNIHEGESALPGAQ